MLDSAGSQTSFLCLKKVESKCLLPQRDATVSFPYITRDNLLHQELITIHGRFFQTAKTRTIKCRKKPKTSQMTRQEMTDCRKKEWEIHQAEMWREPRFLLHFKDSVLHNQKGSWKARTQICRYKMPWIKITQIEQRGIQSPSRGNPCELMKCKASQCHTMESK